jgi:DNA polymerase III subunit beta
VNKLQIVREELLKPLQQCLNIAEKKSTLPILSYILLDFCDNTLSIAATDTEIQLTIVTTLQYKNPTCKITLPGYKLLEICKGLSEGTLLSISVDAEKAVVLAGKNRFTLLSLPAKDYPLFNDTAATVECKIAKEDLYYLLSKTIFAMAAQDVRHYLNGVLFNIEQDKLEVVTTDSHRLALAERKLLAGAGQNARALVPKNCISEILRVISHYAGDWLISFNEQQITFASQELTLVSKLINEQFIDFKKLIPRAGEKTLTVSCQELKQALTLAAILTNEKSRGVRLDLSNNQLKVTANNPEYEAAETEIEVNFPFDPFSVSFNVAYLLDIIGVTDEKYLSFSFSDGNGVVLVQPEGASDCLFVVMPLLI